MTSRWRDRHHPLAVTSAAAEYDAVLAHMAALGQYHPAGPTDDNPADWAARPTRLARFRCGCGCGARFHVRRHLEQHTRTCPDQGADVGVLHKPNYDREESHQ